MCKIGIQDLANVVMEIKRLHIDILRVSETRSSGNGRLRTDKNYEIIYAEKDGHEHGVGIIIHTRLSEKVSAIILKLDRIIFVRLETKPKPIIIIQAYALTMKSSIEEIDRLYKHLEEVKRCTKNNKIVFIMWVISTPKLAGIMWQLIL